MNIFKRMLSFIIVSILIFYSMANNAYAIQTSPTTNPLKVGVFFHTFNDPFILNVRKNLEDIQKQNENKVNFTFFDANDNQIVQNESIDKAINEGVNLLVINLASRNIPQVQGIIERITKSKIPFILYLSSSPEIINLLANYRNVVAIGVDNEQSGILQGKILYNAWNANKETYDKNGDGVMQYIMFKGPSDSPTAVERSKYSIQAINDAGIRTEEIFSVVCNWNQECAETSMEPLLLVNANKIEAIISNNDAMAIGAIKTLQKYGFNLNNGSNHIPIVGFDGLPEAQELIKQGIMTGTVIQDPSEHAKALYTILMNLASGTAPLNGTDYKFDETGIRISLPVYEYVE